MSRDLDVAFNTARATDRVQLIIDELRKLPTYNDSEPLPRSGQREGLPASMIDRVIAAVLARHGLRENKIVTIELVPVETEASR